MNVWHRNVALSLAVALFLVLASVRFSSLAAQDARDPRNESSRRQAKEQNDQPPIDFNRARMLLQKRNRGEKLTPDERAYLDRAIAARRAARRGGRGGGPLTPRDTTGMTPLTEMSAEDRYKGEDGGLYGGGRNTPPEDFRKQAEAELARIQPLDAEGKPSPSGVIGFISISMSNATQEFSKFKQLADADPARSPRVKIVDCAQGGQAMAEWVDPDARPWQVAAQRLSAAGVRPEQVQAAWIKLANKAPTGELTDHGKKLQRDTLAVIQNAKAKFPNLRVAYLGSRIYGAYTRGRLNPEPYAYESAFVVRWLIQDQMRGDAALNFDADHGAVKAPLLLWGPYFWADGTKPRKADGLVWLREDFAGDGTHPSQSGREKVARMLLDFCKTDPLARGWFLKSKQ